jgi:hypothetical protein
MADITVTAAKVGAIYHDADIVDMIAAEAITAGQAVYQNTDGKAGVADANATGKKQFRGIALKTVGAGQAVPVLKRGHVEGFSVSSLDGDAIAYLSNTAGALATTAATLTVQAGRVTALPDGNLTKVLYIEADWSRTWA